MFNKQHRHFEKEAPVPRGHCQNTTHSTSTEYFFFKKTLHVQWDNKKKGRQLMIMNYSHNISCETTDKKEVGDQKLVFGHSALPLLDVFTLNTVSSSVKQKGRVKDWEGNHRDSQSNRIPLHLSNRWVFPCQVTLDCCRCFH